MESSLLAVLQAHISEMATKEEGKQEIESMANRTKRDLSALQHPPAELGEVKLTHLDRRSFFFILRKELQRSERYNHYLSLVLFRLESPEGWTNTPSVPELLQFLGNRLRRSDYLGVLGEDLIAVLLLHADVNPARVVVERLSREVGLFMGPSKARPKSAFASFPSEANSRDSLLDLAFRRLSPPPIH